MSKLGRLFKRNLWVHVTNGQIGNLKAQFHHLVKNEFDYREDKKTFSTDYTKKTYEFSPKDEDWMTMGRYFKMVSETVPVKHEGTTKYFAQVITTLKPNALLDKNNMIGAVGRELAAMAPQLQQDVKHIYSEMGKIPTDMNYTMADVVPGKKCDFYRVLISVPRDLADIKLVALLIETDNKYWVRLNDTLFRDGDTTFAVKWVDEIPSLLLNSKIK